MIQCVVCLITFAAICFGLYIIPQKFLFGDGSDYIRVIINSEDILFETDEKFLSVALDISFMKCYFHKFSDSDWEKLKQLSSLLSPGYLRLGGTDADRTIFTLNDGTFGRFSRNASCESFLQMESITITGKDWIKLNKFAQNSSLNLIIDLNVLFRSNSQWNSSNAEALIKFSEKNCFSLSFQLGNEPNSFPHVFNKTLTGSQLAEDYYKLKKLLNSTNAYKRSKLIGPEVTRPRNLESSSVKFLAEFLAKEDVVDVVSWHQYYLNGHKANLKDFVNPETLDLLPPQIEAISKVVRQRLTDIPIWISETSSAYGGGAPGLSDRFVASFLWLDKLGVAARLKMSVVIRQSLFQNHYALIDENLTPTPDFWISVLYKKLVGPRVLRVKVGENGVSKFVRIFGHCLNPNSSLNGSIVIYGMNLGSQPELLIPSGINALYPVYSYIFQPEFKNLKAKEVLLNGQRLTYGQNVVQDMIKMAKKIKFPLLIPPESIGFWVIKEVRESGCRR